MKNLQLLTIIFLILFSCQSDEISDKSIQLNNKAINSISVEKYSDALKYSEEAIKADEKNYNAYTIKAQMLIKENKLIEAEKTIQQQLKIKPDFAEAWTFKGLINHLTGNEKQAKLDYQKGIDFYQKRIQKSNFNKQMNVTNEYLNLILIGDSKSKQKMIEIERKYKNDKSIYNFLISMKKHSREEIIKQMLIE